MSDALIFDYEEDDDGRCLIPCEECNGSGLAWEGWDCEECGGLGYFDF